MSLSLVFGHEGGFTNDRDDRGNWTTGKIGSGVLKGTKYGISAMSYPRLDIKNLTLAKAAEIYRKDYAGPIRFDSLPAGVNHAVLDFAINSGATRAVIGLQRAVGVADDGKMGPITLAAINKANPATTIKTMCAGRLALLRDLSTWPRYGKGWTTRVNRVEREALAMVAVPEPIPPPPDIAPTPTAQPASSGFFVALLEALRRIFK
jgi:lysozyme family protein